MATGKGDRWDTGVKEVLTPCFTCIGRSYGFSVVFLVLCSYSRSFLLDEACMLTSLQCVMAASDISIRHLPDELLELVALAISCSALLVALG